MRLKRNKVVNPYRTFRGLMIRCGRSVAATSTFFSILGALKKATQTPAPIAFNRFLAKVKPFVSVRPKKIAGKVARTPYRVLPGTEDLVGLQWFNKIVRKRAEKGIYKKFKLEALDAIKNRGATLKRKEDAYLEAQTNRFQIRAPKRQFKPVAKNLRRFAKRGGKKINKFVI